MIATWIFVVCERAWRKRSRNSGTSVVKACFPTVYDVIVPANPIASTNTDLKLDKSLILVYQ